MDRQEPYKIVIVEDEDISRTTSRSYFERRWKAQVWDASDGKTAIDIIRHHKPDIVLLDVMINGPLNGWQVLAEVRKFDRDVKVILVTGQLEIGSYLKVHAQDITAVVEKPVSLSDLEARVSEALGVSMPAASLPSVPAEAGRKGSYEARKLVHDITNIHNSIRMKCERFVLDHEDGLFKDVPDKDVVHNAVAVLKEVILSIDAAKPTVEKVKDV